MIQYTAWCIVLGFTGHILLDNPNETDKFFASLIFGLSLFGIVLDNVVRVRNK